MTQIEKNYIPSAVESKWYATWLDKKAFSSKVNSNKTPYTIVIPPPNVTGVLHMGHMLNNTIQDILVRRARMMGFETCWVPGTDHASIATETKVVNMLAEQGINKHQIGRDAFLEKAFEWKEKYGGIILEQLKKLGASCDWDRTTFTMDEHYSESVIQVFVELYNKGYIYRGARMVNWDPKGLTALSDEEVNYKEVQSKLYYINYKISGSNEVVTIATTRPETILGDTAICVNPNDERYTHLIGKQVIVPICERVIPIIADEYVDIAFGTGCLKVTPAHDINDYNLGLKHNLPIIDIFNDNGTLNDQAGHYIGEDRFIVRKKIAKKLDELGQLVKVDDIKNNVGFSERTNEVVEPKLSTQWFCKMSDMAKPALDHVMNDDIKIHPAKFKNMYRSWMENIKDWCISRQLWWGHRIPAFYLPNGEVVVAKNLEEALILAKQKDASITADQLHQDEDVLDTWFSSWLWPEAVFDGIRNPSNPEYKYYYPTNDLVTGFDIIFFWVARMVMAGYEFPGEMPFKNVYITGMVRDKQGRKMSKSLGNSPDPLELIEKYSADGVRLGMLLSAPAGNDLLFDEKLCDQGRNFTNKVWNALRLIKGWDVDTSLTSSNQQAIAWMNERINEVLVEIDDHFAKYRISDALMSVYKLVWDDFCSWYLEMIKPGFEQPIDPQTYEATIHIFEQLSKIMHPFMPFLSEEVYSMLKDRSENDLLVTANWPEISPINQAVLSEMEFVKEVISAIRNTRNSKNIAKKELIDLYVKTQQTQVYTSNESIICKLAGASSISFTADKIERSASTVVKSDELFIPITAEINPEEEKATLLKELEYTKGFLDAVNKKLSNERFVSNAPANVLEVEYKKKADAEAKIKTIEDSLSSLV